MKSSYKRSCSLRFTTGTTIYIRKGQEGTLIKARDEMKCIILTDESVVVYLKVDSEALRQDAIDVVSILWEAPVFEHSLEFMR